MVIDHRKPTEDILAELRSEADSFRIVIVDTFAAHFDGKDVNNPVESGEFMRRYRPITQLPGRPTILVSAHPTKNASDSNLVPYGAGAILNEVDGNLTLENSAGRVTLHWQGKIRGPEFEPMEFRIEAPPCPDILDSKGREVAAPVLMPSTAKAAEDADQADQDICLKLLAVMVENPTGTQKQWGDSIGRSKGRVNGYLGKLKADGCVEQAAGRWIVKAKGERLAKTFKPQTDDRNLVPPAPEQMPSCSAISSNVPPGTEAGTERVKTP